MQMQEGMQLEDSNQEGMMQMTEEQFQQFQYQQQL
jgi:hypothetical protein